MTGLSVGVMVGSARVSRPDELRADARHAERLGIDALFAGDHLVAAAPILDSTLALATVAAVTDRIGIGFGVMLPALRGAAWAAKQIATLQVLSGDRVILGVGTGGAVHGRSGWDAVGIPYRERGARTDAALAALPRLIAGEATTLAGGRTVTLAPGAPVPPIWIGGRGNAAIRRAVEHGRAWFPSMVQPAQVASGARRLSELARHLARPVPSIAVGGAALLGGRTDRRMLDGFAAGVRGYGIPSGDASRVAVTGSPARAAERFAEFARAGATTLVLGVIGDDWRRQCELIAEAGALSRGVV